MLVLLNQYFWAKSAEKIIRVVKGSTALKSTFLKGVDYEWRQLRFR